MEDAGVILRQMTMGMRLSRALYAATELGIADHLAGGPRSADVLAALTNTNIDALRRLLRALSAAGVFAESGAEGFALTELSERLRRDHPHSFRAGVLFLGGPARWEMWSGVIDSIRTGKPAEKLGDGQTIFDKYAKDPARGEVMNDAMRAFTALQSRAVLAAYDFSSFGVLMDVGGGTGEMIGSILAATPGLRGILFDLPHVVAHAREVLAKFGVADRCECAPGSFFDSVPSTADAIMIKQVVHDWDDDKAVALLSVCRASMRSGAKLLMIERVMPERVQAGVPAEPFLLDLEMLLGSGGRERTSAEFESVLTAAGLRLVAIHATTAPVSVVEAELWVE